MCYRGLLFPLRPCSDVYIPPVATSLSYPLVLLKSRLQSASHHYPSITSALIDIVRKEGLGGLYRGIGGKLLQSVLTASLLFLGHERVLMGLRKALATK